jgi:sulfatase modifying factor 1
VSSPAIDGGLPDACAPLTTFHRKPPGGLDGGALQNPVSRVTWCDAHAFCKWAGKRLCGGVAADRDASSGEWFGVCSKNGTQSYPYGPAFASGTCTENAAGPALVGSKPGCEGGAPGVFDLSGNVREWIDSCDALDQCASAGSAYTSVPDGVTEVGSCRDTYDYARLGSDPSIGFRCCAAAQ